MKDLIQKLQAVLQQRRPEYFAQLRPGVTDAQLDAFSQRFGVPLPDGFRALYKWRDGQSPDCSDELHRNRMFCSLADIAESKEIFGDMIGSDFETPEHWRQAWIPFLHNGGGSYLCIDTAGEDGRKPGQLVAFWKADADRPVEFPDFEQWLRATIKSLEEEDI